MSDNPWWRRPQLLAAAACLVIGVAVLAGSLRTGPAATSPPTPGTELDLGAELDPGAELDLGDPPAADAPAPDTAPAEVVVYISGAVARPDVYRLPADARVKDAVIAAGGLLAEADSEAVNLAAPLQDAEHIHIPPRGEAALTTAPTTAIGGAGAGRVNLNTASAAELEDLPGVGKTLAERIIARRDERGPFQAIEELREVTGIGEKLFTQIAPLVMVGGQ